MDQRLETGLRVLLAVVVTGLVVGSTVHAFGDFDLNYFGALIQRHGHPYTDTPLLLHQAQLAHRGNVPGEGIWGTPILVALIFEPLSLLRLTTAHFIWDALSVTGIALAIMRSSKSRYWPLYVVAVTLSPAMLQTFNTGNTASLTFIFTALAFASLRDDQPRGAGIWLMIASSLKIYPITGFLAAIRHRKWSMLKSATVTGLTLLALTIAVLGFHSSGSDFGQLRHAASSVELTPYNVGIPGIAMEAFGDAGLPRILGVLAFCIGAGVIWRLCRGSVAITLILFEMLTLLAQPLAWRMYFGVTILGLIALVEMTRASKYHLVAGFIFAFMSLAFTGYIVDINAHGNAIGAFQAAGTIGLIATLISASRSSSPETAHD